MFSGDLTPTPACTHSGCQLAGCEWETVSGQAREVPGPGRLDLLLQIGDVVYTLPPTRSDVKAGVARTWGQMECLHGDPGPGIFPDHHAYLQEASQTAGLARPQLPCTRGFSSAFWCLHLRVHSRSKTTTHHRKALTQNVQSKQEERPEGDTHLAGDAATVSLRGQRRHIHETAAVTGATYNRGSS